MALLPWPCELWIDSTAHSETSSGSPKSHCKMQSTHVHSLPIWQGQMSARTSAQHSTTKYRCT